MWFVRKEVESRLRRATTEKLQWVNGMSVISWACLTPDYSEWGRVGVVL